MLRRSMLCLILVATAWAGDEAIFARARENGQRFDQMAGAIQRVLKAWLGYADARTLLLPDRLPGGSRGLKPGDTRYSTAPKERKQFREVLRP